MILVSPFEPEVRYRTCRTRCANFGFGTLVLPGRCIEWALLRKRGHPPGSGRPLTRGDGRCDKLRAIVAHRRQCRSAWSTTTRGRAALALRADPRHGPRDAS